MKNTLTKDAKNFAVVMFQLMPMTKLVFVLPHRIHPRTRKALDNLVANEYLERISHRQIPQGAEGWEATKKMPELVKGKPMPDKKNLFPLTLE